MEEKPSNQLKLKDLGQGRGKAGWGREGLGQGGRGWDRAGAGCWWKVKSWPPPGNGAMGPEGS